MDYDDAQKIIDVLNKNECVLEWFRPYDEIKKILVEQASQLEPLVSLPPIKWQYEDELPELTDKEYDEMFDFSRVIDGVRMFPYMEINNAKHYLRST